MADATRRLPLFPLNTVLFPGGPLPLRIFEPRYLQMVRDCSANGTEFGVCLIVEGNEEGVPATTVQVGTTARIVDFYTLEDGLLGITATGVSRFEIDNITVQHDGLLIGHVHNLPDDQQAEVGDEFLLLSQIAERLLEQVDTLYPKVAKQQFHDASWLSNRLAELLPFELMEKQALMELSDPQQRLQKIAELMPRFQRD